MEELLDYIQKRQERIKKLKEIELAKAEECDNSIESLHLGLKELIEKSCDSIKQIDKDNSLRSYLEEQSRNMQLQFRMRVQNRQEELARIKSQLLKDIAKQNIEFLIVLSNKNKTEIVYDSLSDSEKAILRFIDSFHNYRLSMQYSEIQGENRAEEARLKYNSLRSLGAEKVKKGIKRLIQKSILNSSDIKPLNDMLKEIREIYKDPEELKERANISDMLEILGIEDKKIKETIINQCMYSDLEERVNIIEKCISPNSAYSILQNNPALLLGSRDRFDIYASGLTALKNRSQLKELEDSIIKSPQNYSSLNSLEALNIFNRTESNNIEQRRDYNLKIVDIILSTLRVKGSIGGSYIRSQYLRKTVFGKVSEKYEAEEFDDTIQAMVRAGALIRHTKKSATDAPISINPHLEDIFDQELRERVRATLLYAISGVATK